MLARNLLTITAVTFVGVLAQQPHTGSVTYTLPGVLGVCGRVCNSTITCKSTTGPNKACSGGDAAVHRDVFYANYNSSLPAAKNPICTHHVSAIGPISTTSATVCGFCTNCNTNDLQLSDPTNVRPGQTGTWLLFTS